MDLNKQGQSKDIHIDDLSLDEELQMSGLMPRKKELHQKFITTLKQILPHLGKDETKIVSALIILALKLEGIIGKDISTKDTQLIEILKGCVFGDADKRDAAMAIAERLTIPNQSDQSNND